MFQRTGTHMHTHHVFGVWIFLCFSCSKLPIFTPLLVARSVYVILAVRCSPISSTWNWLWNPNKASKWCVQWRDELIIQDHHIKNIHTCIEGKFDVDLSVRFATPDQRNRKRIDILRVILLEKIIRLFGGSSNSHEPKNREIPLTPSVNLKCSQKCLVMC